MPSRSRSKTGRQTASTTRSTVRWLGGVPADQLANVLTDGDILLFRGRYVADGCIRCCTRSEYNHAAIVVELDDELHVFEATNQGVGSCPLEFYINSVYWHFWGKRQHKIAIRRLHTPYGHGLSPERRLQLRAYARELLGRKYTLDPRVYLKALLHRPQQEDFSSLFCSELVAGAFKRLGLLPPTRSANDYLPEDFTWRRRLALIDARLGREHIVHFKSSSPYAPIALRLNLSVSGVPAALEDSKSVGGGQADEKSAAIAPTDVTITVDSPRLEAPPPTDPPPPSPPPPSSDSNPPPDASAAGSASIAGSAGASVSDGSGPASESQHPPLARLRFDSSADAVRTRSLPVGGRGGGGGMSSLRATFSGSRRLVQVLTAEEEAVETEAGLAQAWALYNVRRWMRRALRERERRRTAQPAQPAQLGFASEALTKPELAAAAAAGASASAAVAEAEVQIELREG